jgi:hypothetical protein
MKDTAVFPTPAGTCALEYHALLLPNFSWPDPMEVPIKALPVLLQRISASNVTKYSFSSQVLSAHNQTYVGLWQMELEQARV